MYWFCHRHAPKISLWVIETDRHHWPVWMSYVVLPQEGTRGNDRAHDGGNDRAHD